MSKLDEFFSKAQTVVDAAGKKTGEMVELSKLKLQAVQLNRDISKAYERLGTVEYEQVKTGVDNGDLISVCVSEIDSLLASLGELNEKIASSQDTINCPNCGARNPIGSVYCSRCGSGLSGEEAAYSRPATVEEENQEEIQMKDESL